MIAYRRCILHASVTVVLMPVVASADHPAGVLGPQAGGPVVTPTADVLPAHGWSLSLYNEYRSFDVPNEEALEHQAAEAGHVHSVSYLSSPSLGVAYGITDRLTMAVRLPYVRRSDVQEAHAHDDHSAGVHNLGHSSGLGDVSLGAYRRLWDDGDGSAATLSFGSFIPTGATDEVSDEGTRFATEHQPGSGAWRPFLGGTYSRVSGRTALHGSLRYTWANEGAQQTDLGDRVDYNLAFSFRLMDERAHRHDEDEPETHSHDHDQGDLRWDLLLELNGEYQRPQQIAGVVENHREHVIFLSPGLRLSGGSWTVALSLGLPIYQDVGHEHVETQSRPLLSFAYSF